MSQVNDLRAEIEARREQIARLDQERADLQLEIDAFRDVYIARVGPAQAALQALQLHIAEYKLRIELIRLRGPSLDAAKLEAEVDWQLRGRREQFDGYAESVRQAERVVQAGVSWPVREEHTDIKELYRDLAKRVHPDLSPDADDRERRGALMADINEAYAQADRAALAAILARLGASDGREFDAGSDWLLAERERLDGVIRDLRSDIAELNRSDWIVMKLDAALARSRGIDWFGRVRRQIESQVAAQRAVLDELVAQFMELVRSVGLT